MLTVVTGPPAAGKSSWIAAHAKPHDVVIDFDKLALALSGPGAPDHRHEDVVEKITHRARFAAIDEAVRHIREHDVYLIHTQPNDKARAKYRRLGARLVVVDPGRDVVLARVEAMRKPGMAAVVTRWYNAQAKHDDVRTVASQTSRRW